MMHKICSRTEDESLLCMLRMRCDGQGSGAICLKFGTTSAMVRIATNRVTEDDLRYSGEPRKTVMAGYPWRLALGYEAA